MKDVCSIKFMPLKLLNSCIIHILHYICSVRTTNFQRTIDSARCMVAGMFGKENLKGTLLFSFKVRFPGCIYKFLC